VSAAAVTAKTMTAMTMTGMTLTGMAIVHVMQRAAEAAIARPAIRLAVEAGHCFEPGPARALALHKSHRDRTDRSSAHQGEHDSSRTLHIASFRDIT
jgi:hypothetical protein